MEEILAGILIAQGNLGDETRGLFERSLAISIRNEGPDGLNAAVGNCNIGRFYHRLGNIQPTVDSQRTQLLLAKSHFVEAQREGRGLPQGKHRRNWLLATYQHCARGWGYG